MSSGTDERTRIEAEETPRKYFAMIPHLVDDLDLSVYAYRLYGHMRRVIGESHNGKCWQSTSTLAEHCKMSMGSVCKAKKELQKSGLIRVELETGRGTRYHVITIVNIWRRNIERYSEQTLSQGESAPSPDESALSQGERKKNPIKKNAKKNTISPTASDTPNGNQPSKDKLAEFGITGEKWHAEHGTSSKSNGKGPWVTWGDGKVHPRDGIEARYLQRVGWMVEKAGWRPTDSEWKGWMLALSEIHQAARGDFDLIQKGIDLACNREAQYRPKHPMGFVNAIRQVQPDKTKPTSAERRKRERERMESDPQYQAAAALEAS